MRVTASIVTYNNADEIISVLQSLSKIKIDNFKIIIVDNASTDNTKELIEKNYSAIELIKSDTNLGFGAGHNVAIRKIESDYHIFINPDITVEENQIEKMLGYMEQHKEVVLLTPKVLNKDGTEQYLPKIFPKFKYIISGSFEHKSKLCHKWRSQYTFRNKLITQPVEIQYSTGCFMVCRTEALKKVGGFDERYFLHFEDADLTREMMKHGKVIYNPNVYVTHGWHRDNVKDKKIRKIALQSWVKYFMKWRFSSK